MDPKKTWIRKSDGHLISEIKEYGYNVLTYRKPRKLDLGGGVMLIYKENLRVSDVKTIRYGSFEHIMCKVMTDDGPFGFVNLYRPEYSKKNRYTVNKFLSDFSKLMSEVMEESYPYFIMGDFNLHVELIKKLSSDVSNAETANIRKKFSDALNFLDMINDFNFTQVISQSTHELGGTLDLLLASDINAKLIQSLHVCDKDEVCESDHYAVCFGLDVKPIIEDNSFCVVKRDYESFDKALFCADIQNSNLENKFKDLTLNECVDLYNHTLKWALDKQCPAQEIIVKSRPKQK